MFLHWLHALRTISKDLKCFFLGHGHRGMVPQSLYAACPEMEPQGSFQILPIL